jgi:Family of unknown function (DUF6088)
MKKRQTNTAAFIRQQIEAGGEAYWRHTDFAHLPSTAVSKALSRLAANGILERVSKGLYYRPRLTRFGRSRPSPNDFPTRLIGQNLHPAGLSAANLLGFTTQNSIQGEFATSASSVPRTLIGSRTRIHTRRPPTWNHLEATDAALLDFLRSRGKLSELSVAETTRRLLDYFRDGSRLERLLAVADAEPPRVRAMLGAIGQEIGCSANVLEPLRKSLNPVSRFDFGSLSQLCYAREWQSK